MTQAHFEQWLSTLGYAEREASLFRSEREVPPTHPYASELRNLLDPQGLIRAKAVFEVDGTPTVAFVEAMPGDALDAIRQRIWNQNLVTIVLEIEDDRLRALSPQRSATPLALDLAQARADGQWSAVEVQSGDIAERLPTWFQGSQRVERELLDNLGEAVRQLRASGLSRDAAQYLMGQLLFVSYLEHRGIISEAYRADRRVKELKTLVNARDHAELSRLFNCLKGDFNGDFLNPEYAKEANWASLSPAIFEILDRFLFRVNLQTGQTSLWNYDFRFIPVELLSGIYETFLGEEKDELGAFYTPRHLAQLVVDLAFDGFERPWEETIYDGACGSGILLTTAFRRMLGHARAAAGKPILLTERIEMLRARIFGSDLSETACRVTAFSLYLSLLEDLVPQDLVELTSDPEVKLPKLLGCNLQSGRKAGDFFSATNEFAGHHRYSILLSNPPWHEASLPSGRTAPSFESWADKSERVIVRRQIAAAFAQRSIDSVTAAGRLVLILPISLLLAPTSQRFLVDWLARARPELIINFGDMRRQMFAEADHGCGVVVARPRNPAAKPLVPAKEYFDYWAPKVDVSLAFGRLTLHTGDRARVQTQEVIENNAVLRYRAWGSEADARLVRRLLREGTLADLCEAQGWVVGKGFNRARHNSEKLDPAHLRDMRFLDAKAIPRDWPVVPKHALTAFPDEIDSVVSYGSQDGIAFSGHRVVYPDGLSSGLEMRAAFVKTKCCFKHTVAAIRGKPRDEDLLRFLAIYLRSPLVRYLILHTAFSPANERERITVREVDALPIKAPMTAALQKIVTKVADISRVLEAEANSTLASPPELDKAFTLIETYMGLTTSEKGLVRDVAKWALPSRQRGDEASIATPWQAAPSDEDLLRYAQTLQTELAMLSKARGGRGSFGVKVHAGRRFSGRGVGVIEVILDPKERPRSVQVQKRSLDAVEALLAKLAQEHILPMEVTENLFLSADLCVLHGNRAYFVKPLARRLWRVGLAAEDADRLVEIVVMEHAA